MNNIITNITENNIFIFDEEMFIYNKISFNKNNNSLILKGLAVKKIYNANYKIYKDSTIGLEINFINFYIIYIIAFINKNKANKILKKYLYKYKNSKINPIIFNNINYGQYLGNIKGSKYNNNFLELDNIKITANYLYSKDYKSEKYELINKCFEEHIFSKTLFIKAM